VPTVEYSRNIHRMPDFQHRHQQPGSLLSAGGMIPVVSVDPSLLLEEGEFRHRMGWTARKLEAEEASGRVFHLVVEQAARYPAFYADFDLAGRRRLATVFQLLGDLPGGSKWQFFTGAKGSLGGTTPLEALREGMLRRVKATAEGFAER
jgi:hypothetical protein